jgi:hypothetical protein
VRRALGVEKGGGLAREAGAGEAGGRDLDHHREQASFGVADGRHRAGKRGFGIGRRPALDVEAPAFGDGLAPLLRRHDGAAGDPGEREIDHQRRPAL